MDKLHAHVPPRRMRDPRRLRNLITDVPGLRVGQATDARVRTGVTVILPDERAVCAVDVRGGGPGHAGDRRSRRLRPWSTRWTRSCCPAARSTAWRRPTAWPPGWARRDGAMEWWSRQACRVLQWSRRRSSTISPTAATRIGAMEPPYGALGVAAVEAAGVTFELGSTGAGAGAMAGALEGRRRVGVGDDVGRLYDRGVGGGEQLRLGGRPWRPRVLGRTFRNRRRVWRPAAWRCAGGARGLGPRQDAILARAPTRPSPAWPPTPFSTRLRPAASR